MAQRNSLQDFFEKRGIQYVSRGEDAPYERMLQQFVEESALIEQEAETQGKILLEDNVALKAQQKLEMEEQAMEISELQLRNQTLQLFCDEVRKELNQASEERDNEIQLLEQYISELKKRIQEAEKTYADKELILWVKNVVQQQNMQGEAMLKQLRTQAK